MSKNKWQCMNEKGQVLTTPDREPHIVEAHTMGEAKSLFKKAHGVAPTPAGKKRHTTRKRLPEGYRVRLVGFQPK